MTNGGTLKVEKVASEIEKLLVKEPVIDDSDLTEEDKENIKDTVEDLEDKIEDAFDKIEDPKEEEEKLPQMGGGDGETPVVPKV